MGGGNALHCTKWLGAYKRDIIRCKIPENVATFIYTCID